MKTKKRNKSVRVVVAMSGGVDSSVAAALLKKQGFDVVGVFLKFWHDPNDKKTENACCSLESANDARAVAEKLNIPFYVLDVSKEFKQYVVDYFIKSFEEGITPNPCVRCNKFIKFGWLFDKTKELDADYLATGHYARVKCSFTTSQKGVRSIEAPTGFQWRLRPTFCDYAHSQYSLHKAKDKNKDQSYFLWQLSKYQLKHIIFPVGNLNKHEVRALAKKLQLPVFSKSDSQDICFIPKGQKDVFLKRYIGLRQLKGNIVDKKGNILGVHEGLAYYTVGQRHGLDGIQLQSHTGKNQTLENENKSNAGFKKAYVLKLDTKNNKLVVGEEEDLYTSQLFARELNWLDMNSMRELENKGILSLNAKIRYNQPEELCKIFKTKSQDIIKIKFNKPLRAITSGQSIVFYKSKNVVGGGVIKSVGNNNE